jgi:thiamine-monophosphate kinase
MPPGPNAPAERDPYPGSGPEPEQEQAEFSLIRRWFTRPATGSVALGVGDDCALLDVPPDRQLAVSIDTLVAGLHFFADTDPEGLGHKSLAVGLSDLAAMAAEPAWATLALTLPDIDSDWLQGFSRGLFALADRYGLQLVGGDTTRGPLSITLQVHGLVPSGRALTRGGARPGDGIWVSGWPGEAALALAACRDELALVEPWTGSLMTRLQRPEPRVEQGLALRGIASAAIDLSDGLAADLGHVLARSGVAARLDWEALPVSPALLAHIDPQQARALVLEGGDDYELCITVPPGKEALIQGVIDTYGVGFTRIGEITAGSGLRCFDGQGRERRLPQGFLHF